MEKFYEDQEKTLRQLFRREKNFGRILQLVTALLNFESAILNRNKLLHAFILIYPRPETDATYAGQAVSRSCVDPHEEQVHGSTPTTNTATKYNKYGDSISRFECELKWSPEETTRNAVNFIVMT